MKESFGQILHSARVEKGLTLIQLSKEIGVSKSVISLWEKDRCEPTLTKIAAICKSLDLDGNYLLGLKDFND